MRDDSRMADAKRIYELMVLTAWADGKVEASEALAVHEIVQQQGFKDLVGRGELAKQLKARIDSVGLDAAVREVAAGLTAQPDRELAFRCCAQVLDADGELGMEEAEILNTLQELFSLSGDDVKRLMANLNS
jgi:uncharacterized tellurite resistance protein B-like protein